MQPLRDLKTEEAARLVGLLFDLDDTFLTDGLLRSQTYQALWDLSDAGLKLAIVTGRPVGWVEVLVRIFPVSGGIAENGNLFVVRERSRVQVVDSCVPDERRSRRIRLARLADEMRNRVPDAKVAGDAHLRASDLTWDIGEHQRVPPDRVAMMRDVVLAHGARVSVSSVHLHATFDAHDKATGALQFARSIWDADPTALRRSLAFIGDSGNDAACFAAFHTTFGVSNVADHMSALSVPPRYIASFPSGAGFVQVANAILQKRSG